MYDVVVIGQGLTGMLSAIWTKEEGASVAIISQGTGRILQSTGVMDILPGTEGTMNDLIRKYQIKGWNSLLVEGGIDRFKTLMVQLGNPYQGSIEQPVEIVTGSGFLKSTALYPTTVSPIPHKGHVVVVGFQEITDFQPSYVAENLASERPELTIDHFSISLEQRSHRTMTQLDAARLLEQKEVRNQVIQRLKDKMKESSIHKSDLVILPSVLGVIGWESVWKDFKNQLDTTITEAVGMPPNATAIRLHEQLHRETTRLGVRQYLNSKVVGSKQGKQTIESVMVRNANHTIEIKGTSFVLATGGILGGGMEKMASSITETTLGLEVDQEGNLINPYDNLYLVGASQGLRVTSHGITGGIFSILSSYETVIKNNYRQPLGGEQHDKLTRHQL
ncbi:FAD-binding protein [Tepidibacillus fermentans]|uniref:Glycerol 3-phosphate dehydrogenase (Quinone) subunit B n=1 Tax=Tepidibacillus fermentans TaxID=1281767 RepID=A0A4R3KIC0_9BACI|nr:FAD-binding protein [Tepidibacillus fermentans]TCS83186.1 glycerol 3-phosphate dehydrogenase (quinone) subunit B [Tepidibacillus fermentans]